MRATMEDSSIIPMTSASHQIGPKRVSPRTGRHRSPKSPSGTSGQSGILQPETVVDRMTEFLLAAQVTFSRLNRCVTEKELYLLQFSAGQMAQPGACTTQIVRGKTLDSSALRSAFHDMPYRLWREAIAPKFANAVYPSEDGASAYFGGGGPGVNRMLHPCRDWDGADIDRKSTRLNSSHLGISYAVFC